MAVAAPSQRLPPSQSLYLANLPEKLQKSDLRRELYTLLSTYGPVLDINALRTAKMRGQAHVLFKDVQSATLAMRGCQGLDWFGREMKISYSTNRSNTLAKLTGVPNQPSNAPSAQAAQPPTSFPAPPGGQTTLVAPPTGLPAPPSGLPAPPTGLPAPPSGLPPPPSGLPAPPASAASLKPLTEDTNEVASPQGTKRAREESEDEEDGDGVAEVEMEEDEDEMEMSDEE